MWCAENEQRHSGQSAWLDFKPGKKTKVPEQTVSGLRAVRHVALLSRISRRVCTPHLGVVSAFLRVIFCREDKN